jgi:hypothetical protein
MSKIPVLTAIRLIPREQDYLDRKSGSRGEVFFDNETKTLRLYDGINAGGTALAKSDLTNIDNATFAAKVTASGFAGGGGGAITIAADDSTQKIIGAGEILSILGGDGIGTTTNDEGALTITNTANNFGTILVDGQDNIVADLNSDTLTIVAGTNIQIETDSAADSITIHATAGASTNSFANIAISGQNTLVADSGTDTLTLVAGSGIGLATDSATDTITITNSQSPGITTFSAATDATSASLTVDKFYLPAITKLAVTNNGASSYRFDQYGTTDNPTIFAINATTIAFNLDVGGHPFEIQTGAGSAYNSGLYHVSNTGTVSTGASAQGKTSGTLYWKIPSTISGGYRYQCTVHAGMVGSITIKDFGSL